MADRSNPERGLVLPFKRIVKHAPAGEAADQRGAAALAIGAEMRALGADLRAIHAMSDHSAQHPKHAEPPSDR